MVTDYPSVGSFDERTGLRPSEKEASEISLSFKLLKDLVVAARQIRAELQISPAVQIKPLFSCPSDAIRRVIEANSSWIRSVMRAETITLAAEVSEKPKGCAVSAVVADLAGVADDVRRVDIYVPLAGAVDIDKEKERLMKEIAKAEEEVTRVSAKLGNRNFVERAAADIVEKERAKLEKYRQIKEKLQATLKSFES